MQSTNNIWSITDVIASALYGILNMATGFTLNADFKLPDFPEKASFKMVIA